MQEETLKWQHTPPSHKVQRDVRNSFLPRARPIHLFVTVDSRVLKIEPIDYLIGFSNGNVSVGIAKNKDLSQDQPLTMQFGNWKSRLSFNELYIGCTVRVTSYYRVLQNNDNKPMSLKPLTEQNNMYYNCRLSSNTVACDWAIVNKPQIKRTLGVIEDFRTKKMRDLGVYFEAIVYDQEYNERVDVYADQWPNYIKKAVQVETPVILNWIFVEEPHRLFYSFENFPTLLPDRDDLESDEKICKGKWFGWVDTRYSSV